MRDLGVDCCLPIYLTLNNTSFHLYRNIGQFTHAIALAYIQVFEDAMA
jgi:hypothetical protein